MFRVAVLSLVLTLAVGQNAWLLCNVWCHPPDAPTVACHHHDDRTGPSVTGNDTCSVVVGISTFVREDLRSGGSAPDLQHANAIPRYQFAPSTNPGRTGTDSAHQWSLQKRPLEPSLRI